VKNVVHKVLRKVFSTNQRGEGIPKVRTKGPIPEDRRGREAEVGAQIFKRRLEEAGRNEGKGQRLERGGRERNVF